MKLSTKGRYGMRAMLDIAQHYHEGLVLVKDVAARQQISERYLEQLCLTLKTSGLVKSTRGSRGGLIDGPAGGGAGRRSSRAHGRTTFGTELSFHRGATTCAKRHKRSPSRLLLLQPQPALYLFWVCKRPDLH